MAKSPKRFPEPPLKFETPEQIPVYLRALVKELTSQAQKGIEGPLNKTTFAPVNFTDKRDLDPATATLANTVNVLCTLIQVLKDGGLLK